MAERRVRTVNIGIELHVEQPAQQWLDIDGYSPHHAELMENRRIGRLEEPRCEEPSSGGGGGGGGGGRPRGSVNDGASILPSSPFGRHLEEILGIREAAAATPYTEVWTQGGCIARNPERISHWRLFQLVDGTDWKGCVEARPAPYDVTDEAPSTSNPSTLFVPYFWMDDLDGFTTRIANYGYVNDWVDDGPFLPDTDTEWDMWPRHFNVLKYRPGNPTRIDEVAPDTLGPNKACADPILPLTNDYGMISRRIDQLTVWNRGGTVASEGVAWAWRALSPTPPFTEGAAYGETLKIIIIMTDGQNMTLENPNDVPLADYSAYGYMRDGRVGQENFPQWTRFLNERLQLVCENAKQSGVLIYAVTFGLTDPVQRRMWDECASEPSMAYHVDFASELETAYRQIAASIGRLRLVR